MGVRVQSVGCWLVRVCNGELIEERVEKVVL